ncbi:MAG: type II and III secretion system protein family protein [Pseudomonadota bacterium]
MTRSRHHPIAAHLAVARISVDILARAILVSCLAVAGAIGFGLSSVPAKADAPIYELRSGAATGRVAVDRGKSRTVQVGAVFSEIVVGDSEIADIAPLTDTSFYVLGKALGTTSVALFDLNGALIGSLDIEVTSDLGDLQATLEQELPGSNISVRSINGQILLSGHVGDAASAQRAVEIAGHYSDQVVNTLSVAGPQQVMLEVRFLEAARSATRELGVNWTIAAQDLAAQLGTAALVSGAPAFGTVLARLVDGGTNVDVLIQALERRGVARRLAEPNLVAMSGDTASFLAGGEFPFPVAQDDNRITIEFKKFGVGLSFTPTVLSQGKIHLVIEPEVSQIDPTISLKFNDIEIPSLIVRRASTSVELRDGQSFVIAGLLQATHSTSQDRIPWLGDVPVLGTLFRSANFRRQETDLAIIVTPRLVQPAAPGTEIRTPFDDLLPGNDIDVFVNGNGEVPPRLAASYAADTGHAAPGLAGTGHILDIATGSAPPSKSMPSVSAFAPTRTTTQSRSATRQEVGYDMR